MRGPRVPPSTDDQPTDPLPVRGRRWRTAPHIQERLRTVADLRRRGIGQAQIAAEVGVSQATISRDLAHLDLIERHEHAEFTYTQQFESLLSLRELTLICWEVISRYRYDPDRIADLAAVASVVVAAQREAGRILAGARDPNAGDSDGENRDNRDIIEGEILMKGLLDTRKPDYGEGEIADLRREVDIDIGRYASPKELAVIQRGLALAQDAALDATPDVPRPAE